MCVRRHRLLAEANAVYYCLLIRKYHVLWLKKGESCNAAGAPPQTPLKELGYTTLLGGSRPGISFSALAAAYQPSLQNPRPALILCVCVCVCVWGGGGGGGGGAIIALCPRALNNHTTPLPAQPRALPHGR